MADVKFTRGASTGVDGKPLVDGQVLFDKEKKRILMDAYVDDTLTRITMKESQFTGTTAEWEALTEEEKAQYAIVNITDDYEVRSSVFRGATALTDGDVGLVTKPHAGDQDKLLSGSGDWVKPSAEHISFAPGETGLEATDLQDALTEVNERVSSVAGESVLTFDSTSAPTEASDKIYQYTGTDSGDLVNGYFYKVEEVTPATDPKTYKWVNVSVQPASSTIDVIDNLNSTSTTDALSANQGKVLGDKLPFGLSITNDTYGYEKADGTFVPFKSQADIDSAVAAAMVGTATAADVLAPKTFTNSSTSGEVGTMVDNGAVSKTLDATTNNQSYTVPQGYHNGNGTVNIVLEEKSATPTTSSQDITPTNGKVLSKVTVGAVSLTGDADEGNVLNGKTFYKNNLTKKTGSMTNNGAVSKTLDATSNNQTYTVPEGYHNGSGTVKIVLEEKSVTPSSSSQTVTPTSGKVLSKVTVGAAAGANLQSTKAAGTVTPSANWSGSSTSSYTITKDSNYDGMVNATFSVPMIRDDNIFQYVSSGTPSTVYQGDSSVSNSKELMKIAPYKDGMVYTNSYLYVDPTLGGWTKGGGSATSITPSNSSPAYMSSGTTYKPTTSGYAIVDYSNASVSPSSSGIFFYTGWNYMTSQGYAYSSRPSASPTETVLWTNSSPSSSFSSQAVSLSQSYENFDYVAIEYRMDTTQPIGSSYGKRIIVEPDQFLGMNESSSYGLVLLACPSSTWYCRRVHSGGAYNVSFKACYQYGTTTTSNTKCIPYRVVGIKY